MLYIFFSDNSDYVPFIIHINAHSFKKYVSRDYTCNGFAKQGLGHTRIEGNPPGWWHQVGDSSCKQIFMAQVPSTFMEVGTGEAIFGSVSVQDDGAGGTSRKEWQERERMLLRKKVTAQAQENLLPSRKCAFLERLEPRCKDRE